MAKTQQTESLTQMIELLRPLNSDERQRLVSASLTFLGDNPVTTPKTSDDDVVDDGLKLSPRARTWTKQSGITADEIQQVFSVAQDGVEVIAAEIPGGSTREKTINAYVLTGLANYLASGDLKFDDKSARAVCSKSGCYDATNHATNLKSKGNLFTGNKETGWALTTPGLKHAAGLIKTLTKSS